MVGRYFSTINVTSILLANSATTIDIHEITIIFACQTCVSYHCRVGETVPRRGIYIYIQCIYTVCIRSVYNIIIHIEAFQRRRFGRDSSRSMIIARSLARCTPKQTIESRFLTLYKK